LKEKVKISSSIGHALQRHEGGKFSLRRQGAKKKSRRPVLEAKSYGTIRELGDWLCPSLPKGRGYPNSGQGRKTEKESLDSRSPLCSPRRGKGTVPFLRKEIFVDENPRQKRLPRGFQRKKAALIPQITTMPASEGEGQTLFHAPTKKKGFPP